MEFEIEEAPALPNEIEDVENAANNIFTYFEESILVDFIIRIIIFNVGRTDFSAQ